MASGLYSIASEVASEALRLMEEQDRLRAAKLEQLRHDIREGLDSDPATPWSLQEAQQEGRTRRAARLREG
nr:type II toxin-antitoxin system ParD family antitoxin [uncultured Thiodictyon sp.]